ncbi:hypothetical protein EOS_36250 [Caballeronia mineralivorans PML1(12)]|uniref:Transmembrane protein n=1 Tax=Caballeronia mineralivorans PML1(12) TaxID=908627 RepID=A0A0J1CLK1_9BURK|nr:hypothetical protein [Caballeronia mineralivorans]KLU21419.1 hypothetical protein EOS_36250 [Caballeronia mineralivorans PML1(12)]
MSDHPESKGSQTGRADEASGDSAALARVLQDVERCEALIAHGARTGAPPEDADIDIVRAARLAVEQNTLSATNEADVHAAMGRIARAVRYPGAHIADDMDRCGDMVSYAAQMGKVIPESDVASLSVARAAQQQLVWNAMTEALFYAGMSRIARCVAPVVAGTTGAQARKGAQLAIKIYTWSAFILAFFVISLSCLLFVANQISADVSKVVDANDSAALTMHNMLQAYRLNVIEAKEKGPDAVGQLQNSQPALQIKELLQQFATNNRQLYADVKRTEAIRKFLLVGDEESPYKPVCPAYSQTGKQADAWNVNLEKVSGPRASPDATMQTTNWNCDPDSRRRALEIDLPLLATGPMDQASTSKSWRPEAAVEQGFQKIAVYQDIRAMATNDRDVNLAFVGAITSFLLPVLYAWLGACASILRQLSAESSASLFHPEHSKVAYRAHITSAVIVGISIGLFTEILQGGKEFSPLAIAFVAGYASDKFFAFIDRIVSATFPARVPARAETVMPSPVPKNISPPGDAASSGMHA